MSNEEYVRFTFLGLLLATFSKKGMEKGGRLTSYLHTFFCEGALGMAKIFGTIPTGTLS